MHLWYLENWKNWIDLSDMERRSGLMLRFDAEVEIPVREFCKKFAKWLRREFFFPIKVSVYIKSSYRIRAKDGDYVVGTFLWPGDYGTEPYIRIATGDYQELREKKGEEQAMWSILESIAHELTHYFQYINQISLTRIGEERQATTYANYILSDYYVYLKNGEKTKAKKDIWRSVEWEKNIDLDRKGHRTGLGLRFEKNIENEVRNACKELVMFLREEYFFPIRVVICIKNSSTIVTEDGVKTTSVFERVEDDYTAEPYIRIAAGEYKNICAKLGKDKALNVILFAILQELTHYFQWVNALHLTPRGKQRQATRYAKCILDEYAENSIIYHKR